MQTALPPEAAPTYLMMYKDGRRTKESHFKSLKHRGHLFDTDDGIIRGGECFFLNVDGIMRGMGAEKSAGKWGGVRRGGVPHNT